MQFEELRERIKPFNLREVSRQTGIKYGHLYWVVSGRIKNPPYDTVYKLIEFIKQAGK